MVGFDSELYKRIQKEKIEERIKSFKGKLYLEFGGKLIDDSHASRVLPGFEPDLKLQMLLQMKDKAEIVIVVNSNHIRDNKIRNDSKATYDAEVERFITTYRRLGFQAISVVLSFYEDNEAIRIFTKKLKNKKIPVYKHYKIAGYPENIPLIVSELGLGKNEYIKTTQPLVVVTAPGPGSGKMATCLSQLYHDQKNGIKSGYAKWETFPVWNLSILHPVNIAYEAATVDLDDVNMIDPYHFEHYGIQATNYNRDVEVFPLLVSIFKEIYGKSPYHSPTDMGVNMVGAAIKNEKAVIEASKQEIIRRYYQVMKNFYTGIYDENCVKKIQMLMNHAGVSVEDRKVVNAAIEKSKEKNAHVVAIQLPDGRIVTGKRTPLLTASAAAVINALKVLANINDKIDLFSKSIIEPITILKTDVLTYETPNIRLEEILITLAVQATTNPLAKLVVPYLKELAGSNAHSTCIISKADLKTMAKLGILLTEELVYIDI